MSDAYFIELRYLLMKGLYFMENNERIRKILREELTRDDERKISKMLDDKMDKKFNKKEFEKKVKDIVSKSLKDNKDVENKMEEVASNIVTQLFKTLWVRRNVWRSRLKNKPN